METDKRNDSRTPKALDAIDFRAGLREIECCFVILFVLIAIGLFANLLTLMRTEENMREIQTRMDLSLEKIEANTLAISMFVASEEAGDRVVHGASVPGKSTVPANVLAERTTTEAREKCMKELWDTVKAACITIKPGCGLDERFDCYAAHMKKAKIVCESVF